MKIKLNNAIQFCMSFQRLPLKYAILAEYHAELTHVKQIKNKLQKDFYSINNITESDQTLFLERTIH